MANVRTAIERLYATGRFADIQIDAQGTPDGRRVDHARDAFAIRSKRRCNRGERPSEQRTTRECDEVATWRALHFGRPSIGRESAGGPAHQRFLPRKGDA